MTGARVSPGPGRTSGDEATAAKHPDPAEEPLFAACDGNRGNQLRFSRPNAPPLKGQARARLALKCPFPPHPSLPFKVGPRSRFNANTRHPAGYEEATVPVLFYWRSSDDTRDGRIPFRELNSLASEELPLIARGTLIGLPGEKRRIFEANCCSF